MKKLAELFEDVDWFNGVAEYKKCETDLKTILSTIKIPPRNITPAPENIFKAFRLTKFDDVKVVILGQDPYPQEGCATGLAFALPQNKMQPSLLNIFKRIEALCDKFDPMKANTSLEGWARQGVLLFNRALTVPENGKPGTHVELWKTFIEKILGKLSERTSNPVFILFGNKKLRKKLKRVIGHAVFVESYHPSRARWFFKEKNKNNLFLECNKQLNEPINWCQTG